MKLHSTKTDFWRDFATRTVCLRDNFKVELKAWLSVTKSKNPRIVVFCETDRLLIDVSCVCRELCIRFTSHEAVVLARRKDLLRQKLNDRFKVPNFKFQSAKKITGIGEAIRDVGLPCILKPVSGAGSALVYPIRDARDVDWFVDEYESELKRLEQDEFWFSKDGWLCETLVEGPMVTAFVACNGHTCRTIAVAQNLSQPLNSCVGFGSFCPSLEASKSEILSKFSEQVCMHLGLDYGFFDVEIILGDDGPVLIEVNPRPPGGEMLSTLDTSASVDLFRFILDLFEERNVALRQIEFKQDYLIWKIMSSEHTILTADISAFLQGFLDETGAFLANALTKGEHIKPLDTLARLIVPISDKTESFNQLSRMTTEFSDRSGVRLIEGNFQKLPSYLSRPQ
jgi:phosphoribosylamine-glycine ligase